ncbi:hypothetical protein BJ170DRAFT_301029 [Xylariales sp. AK1849]|nr:hypothetical protein BJ170DRAFT_301029 [Xylariales sp. AK1849]
MLEPWDEVLVLQKERQLCLENVQAVKSSCAIDHDKQHVVACAECWSRLLNRMRDRYLNSATKEWFSGRRLFLQDLDALFSQAHEHKTDLKTIEERITEEKKEWFRDKVRNLSLTSAARDAAEARALQQKLNDRSIPADRLASELRDAFSDGAVINEEALNTFLDRLTAAKSPQARSEAYIEMFFQPGHDPVGATKSQKYIEMVRIGTPITEVVNTMVRDRQSNQGSQDRKQALQKKVEELRRAKAAHEADKAKKAKQRQEKLNAAAAAEERHNYPPCSVCAKAIDIQNFSSCPVCLVLSERYRILDDRPVVFCSTECDEKGMYAHIEESHTCASGQDCINIQDEDVSMDEGSNVLGFCQECVIDLEIESLFCSIQCLDRNFQRHREEVHIPKRDHAGQIGDDEQDLEYESEDKSRYRARKIEDHFIVLEDALREYGEKTGAVF